ncbi:SUMO-interacting motif-containing protein 1 isoform X2 [Dunckerocampus dactyliophorus]|uniref:SUMO-interacting motif-containing protein 1 isoform X2 n=1 Tax=Dunckerocampus dactyliophorus TaxID=161453 RepID=UPI0024054EEF|nr:SUMO-interacting motif-containing protein 1 isoform X2 [Dunckerocampus dactyliophorus]
MTTVITISSDSEEDDSGVEFVSSYIEPSWPVTPVSYGGNDSKAAYLEPISLTDFPLTKKAKQAKNASLEHISSKKECERRVTEETCSGQNASARSAEDATRPPSHGTHADSSSFGYSSSPVPSASPKGNLISQSHKTFHATCDRAQDETTMSRRETKVMTDAASDQLCQSVLVDTPPSVSKSEDFEDFFRGEDEEERESLKNFKWQEEIDEENNANVDFREASQDEKRFVCPQRFQKAMDGLAHTLEEDVQWPTPFCQQSLRLVYTTMQVNIQEGTLQLLSDLLHPGYCPPKDIMSHLLSGILLDPLCSHHHCVQAWNLLMRAQRHHSVDKNTVPWSWELVTSVMSNQDDKKRHRPEVVRMLLDYIVQTLEDDFSYRKSTSELHLSIAKATLSCNRHFPHVKDVIQWMFSSIFKSTGNGDSSQAAREREEHIRIVSSLQRMLSLALEVDCSPALSTPRLSQELFFMLVSTEPRRAHRLLLLDSMQNNLLRCKMLEHMLDYACPLKTPVPMSLSRLLHFLENCTPAADPTDGSERWQKWEELVHHLWMLLVSYNTAMKGYLSSSVSKQTGEAGTLVYKPEDMLTKADICRAVEAFLCRSKVDIGQMLPLHVAESLTYLQDFLLEVCCES